MLMECPSAALPPYLLATLTCRLRAAIHIALLPAGPNRTGTPRGGSVEVSIASKSQAEALDSEGYILKGVQPSFPNLHFCSGVD